MANKTPSVQEQQQRLEFANRRRSYRAQKLSETNSIYFKVLLLLAALQVIAIAFFTRGFLLTREVLPNISTCEDQQDSSTCFRSQGRFKRAIILVIDALRFDFTIPVADDDTFYHNNLRVLYETASEHPEQAVLLKFLADPPTTTLQRLKGLTTGSLPTFVDAGSNFAGDTIIEDNLIRQMSQCGRRVAFAGDDTWDSLFGPYLDANMSFPYASLNVWDLYSVDEGVVSHVMPLMNRADGNEWDLLVGHFLGVDHCGHRYGPEHYAMKGKQEQLDHVIRDVMSKMDDETALFVFGDHGMDSTGNHGGETRQELESALFMYAKKPYFGHLKDESVYNVTDLGRNYRSVRQIDFVPTLSLLLGIPIPYNSLGKPISEAFLGPNGDDYANLAKAMHITTGQIAEYRETLPELASDKTMNLQYKQLNSSWAGVDSSTFIQNATDYQQRSLQRCQQRWATFDDVNIGIGICLLAVAWVLLVIYSKMIPSVVVAQLNPQFLFSSLVLILVYTVLLAAFTFVFKPTSLPLPWALLLGVALGIANGVFAPIADRFSIPWLFSRLSDNMIENGWTYFALLVTVLHTLTFASNSFIVWEDRIVCFWLVSFGVCAFFKSFQLVTKRRKLLGAYHSLMFIILTRIAALSKLCREEQGEKCISTFASSPTAVISLYGVAVALPYIVASFFKTSHCYEGPAPMWISKGFLGVLIVNAITWSFEYLEHDPRLAADLNLSFEFLKTARVTLARISLGVSLIAANVGWSTGPLCIKVEMRDRPKRTARIIGYGNVYGSSYFLFFINILAACMEVQKPMGAASLAILACQILTLCELVGLLNIRTNLITAVVATLLGYLHFFTTGHQATLQSIHWDSAFLLTDSITFPLSHLSVILDTFGSFILISVAIPLFMLWKTAPTDKTVTLTSRIVENATSMLLYQISLTWFSMVMTNNFRRHLMVWKVFAPRYMLNGLILIVMNLVVVLVTVGFATPRVIRRWNNFFG